MFEFFIALRYLRAKRKQVMISVITVISIAGVAAGVMALVIALAINTGFRETLERNLLGLTAHVSIQEKQPGEGISGWQEIAAKAAKLPHVIAATPGLYEPAYVRGPVRSGGLTVKGILVDSATKLPDALVHLRSGSMAALRASDSSGLPGIILGSKLADYIGAVVNKPVTLINPEGEMTPLGPRPSYTRFLVSGTFETGFYDADNSWAFASLHTTQKVFGFDQDVVNSIELRLDDVDQAPLVEREVETIIGPKLAALTWEEQNAPILGAFQTERIVTVITIGLIQLVAALNILIALVMMVMEKQRDIAILMSMGARASQIRNIFVFEGALIGVVGTSIGLIVGYAVCYFADHYRWIPLPEQVYSVAYVPFHTHPIDGLWIAGAAVAVSLIATLYPARNATRIVPVEALRYE
jgi:lipoprotein-releasing system permease protein